MIGEGRGEHRLTRDFYTAFVVAFSEALSLQRPAVMGCSIGGRVALTLAIEHVDRFHALIGLRASAHVAPHDAAEWLHHPDVHGPDVHGGEARALNFYKVNGDLRQRIAAIDTKLCSLFR